MAGADKSFESRRAHRSHWLEIYNSLSDVKLSDDFIAVMMEQDARADGTPLYWTGDLPGLIPNVERTRAESTNEDELGHGWVAVGRLNSDRYSDLNFTVPTKDGVHTIKPNDIIRARWSVTLRSNSRNLEDRKGYEGTSRGLLWGGECAKVIELAARWASPNLGLPRNRAVPPDNAIGSRFRAERHVRPPFFAPVISREVTADKSPSTLSAAFLKKAERAAAYLLGENSR